MKAECEGARGIYMRLPHLSLPVSMNIKKIRRLMNKCGLKCPVLKDEIDIRAFQLHDEV